MNEGLDLHAGDEAGSLVGQTLVDDRLRIGGMQFLNADHEGDSAAVGQRGIVRL